MGELDEDCGAYAAGAEPELYWLLAAALFVFAFMQLRKSRRLELTDESARADADAGGAGHAQRWLTGSSLATAARVRTSCSWVLGPSAFVAELAGVELVPEPGAGFISRSAHMVVGPACAGRELPARLLARAVSVRASRAAAAALAAACWLRACSALARRIWSLSR